jgi:hypothetical protein
VGPPPGRAKLDDEIVEVSAWDVLRVAPTVARSFEAGLDALDMICIGGRKPEENDNVPLWRARALRCG